MSVHVVTVAIPAQTVEVRIRNADQWDGAYGTVDAQIRERVGSNLAASLRWCGHFDGASDLAGEVLSVEEAP